MPCPKDYLSKKATIDPVVQDYGFFNSKPVNEWTFEEYITGTNPENLEEVYLLLRQFKQSLQSLRRMRSLDRNLKSYIGNLKKRDV
ncbi:uncharacterized protein EV154DRAFT_29970 [Mucor mucedo]|uniref:uncharacterized protein n=1 Tax=Mucor mucedo TaxID=29922 RepID=UPI0022208B96|nr:uncharacterized protein EV154DRAFT_29970 [Mucor mucedo]KAI7883834.1 hypothetical protein EV154DRAFT_29970 [Mucor mucedo]